MAELLNITESEATDIINQSDSGESELKRPDVILKRRKKSTDTNIRQVIVPEILIKANVSITGINYAVRFFCRIEREKTKPMAFSVANMQNMGLLIPISMCGHKQDSVFFIRRHDKETYGYSIF